MARQINMTNGNRKMLLQYKKIKVGNGNDQANLVAFGLKSKDKDVDFRLANKKSRKSTQRQVRACESRLRTFPWDHQGRQILGGKGGEQILSDMLI